MIWACEHRQIHINTDKSSQTIATTLNAWVKKTSGKKMLTPKTKLSVFSMIGDHRPLLSLDVYHLAQRVGIITRQVHPTHISILES